MPQRQSKEGMKTAILCVLFLIIGVGAGSALAGYFVDRSHKRHYATLLAGELGLDAMLAEQIKLGEVTIALGWLENSFPYRVVAIRENELLRDSMTADTAIMATKRFYVCTKTAIPAEIAEILQQVSLPEEACPISE